MINVSDALDCFLQTVKLKTVSVTSVDFEETETVTESNIRSVVQPADKDKLNADNIDWSLEYMWFHTKFNIEIGQYIEYQGKDYKIIDLKRYGDYGYFEATGEETKRTLK